MSCPGGVTGTQLSGTPLGEMRTVGRYDAYFSSKATLVASAAATERDVKPSRKAVVILPDIFGLGINNPKIIADMLNEKVGCDVYVPDLFTHGPICNEAEMAPYMPDEAGVVPPLMTKLRLFWKFFKIIHRIIPNRPSIQAPKAEVFIGSLKEQGYTSVGVLGFCLGGSVAILLADKPDLVKTVIIAHPGPVSTTSVKAMKIPSCWELPEEDDNFSPKQAAEAERILLGKGKQVPCEFKTYKGTSLVLFDACLTEEMVNNAVRQVARMVLRIDRIRQSHK